MARSGTLAQNGNFGWAGMFIAPLAWFLHQQVSGSLTTVACHQQHKLLLHLPALAAVLLLLVGAGLSWRAWRQTGGGPPDEAFGRPERNRFVAVLSLASSALFLLVIVAQEIATFFFSPCLQ